MIARLALSAIAALCALTAAPAHACSIIATPLICADGNCSSPLAIQAQRERAQREAIEFGRSMDVAIEARREAEGLDRAADIARLVFPLVTSPVDYADGASCGPEVEDSAGDEIGRAVPIETFVEDVRTRAALAPPRELPRETVSALASLRIACQREISDAFADYLRGAVPADQIAEAWDFLVPRAGRLPPASPVEPLPGWRLVRIEGMSPAPLFNNVAGPAHVEARRERAWQYLRNHRNGRAVMSAVSQFLASRQPGGEAAICPVAHAETERLIAGLARG